MCFVADVATSLLEMNDQGKRGRGGVAGGTGVNDLMAQLTLLLKDQAAAIDQSSLKKLGEVVDQRRCSKVKCRSCAVSARCVS